MNIAKEFVHAMMRGEATVRDVADGKGLVDITTIQLEQRKGVTHVTLIDANNVTVATTEVNYTPGFGVLNITRSEGFHMQLEVSIHG
jgi:hypothetical protein